MSHNSLTHLSPEQIKHEVKDSKEALEQLVGEPVLMFCYPNGRYSPHIIEEVRGAGYIGARTTWMLSTRTVFSAFEMPTTLQAFPHPRGGYLRDLGRAKNLPGLWRFTTQLSRFERWTEIGKALFDEVLEHGGIWHLYGHSWEIDDLAIWDELEEMLDYVSDRPGVRYLTNAQVLSTLSTNQRDQTALDYTARDAISLPGTEEIRPCSAENRT
jgi:peptidoglycan/xylan/chitin deacetylase (PgdA/CDA1 family)